MWVAEELEHWREFYLMVGTVGATLLALLFVAVSLGAGYLTEARQTTTRIFMSPVVIHFTAVFFLSAIALVPSHRTIFFGVLIGATAVTGLAVAGYTTAKILRSDVTRYLSDRLAYGLLPALAYFALLAATGLVFADDRSALDVLAGALLLLTVINIRNAYDLTLAMVHQHKDPV